MVNKFVMVLLLSGLLSACGSSLEDMDQDQASWYKVNSPSVCAVTAPAITSKLSPRISEHLQAYLAGSQQDTQTTVDLTQCFAADQAYLDYLADPRIDPAPGNQETFVDPAWRAEYYAAWADSVAKLRSPVYAPLKAQIELLGGRVHAIGVTAQQVTVELKWSALKTLLLERRDLLFVSFPAEFPESP